MNYAKRCIRLRAGDSSRNVLAGWVARTDAVPNPLKTHNLRFNFLAISRDLVHELSRAILHGSTLRVFRRCARKPLA
jgi:hypothetical protein